MVKEFMAVLHLLAKKIILDNKQIYVPDRGMVDYTDAVSEIWYDDLIPDATVIIDGLPFHIEIVVTNPISSAKYQKYKSDHIRVLIINLSKEDRDLDYSVLEQLVLYEPTNRYVLSYAEYPIKKKQENSSLWLPWAILTGLTIWFWNTNVKKKRLK